jgi:RecB family exonuclease
MRPSAPSLGIEELLFPALGDRSVRFVFPSEICAESWLERALRLGGRGSLEADRFLGWDRLKEEAARIDGRPPVDDPLRRIFAAGVLAENARDPFLAALIPPEYASSWQPFAGYVASRLPALGRLPYVLREAGPGADAEPRAADWLQVRARYEAFLKAVGRFEPAFEPRALRELGGSTLIFFPELIEDFEEYRAALSLCPSVRLVGLPAEAPVARLRRPETALAELRETLSEIGRLLDGAPGGPRLEAADIAITVAGLERYRPYVEREAELLSIPIAMRSGLGLDATAGGRLFAALRDVAASGFSYDAMRDLLLSPAWPWKDPDAGRNIMAAGRRLHAVASWTKDGREVDVWERSLSGSLLSAYKRLKSRISAISGARDFASLLKSYNAFRGEYLSPNPEDWDMSADLTLARCVVELESLAWAEAEARDKAGLATSDAFGLFMRALEAKPYVSSGGGAGVPVCDWRVAAGVYPERHFILGATQDALAVPLRGFDFLGEALRKRLGSPDRDSAPDFIKAYALSGASVSFSCPVAGWDGEVAAHGFLVSMSREDRAEPADALYRDEAAWLSGRGPAPVRLHRPQAAGLAASMEAAASMAARPPDSDKGAFLAAPTAAAVAGLLRRRPRDGAEGEARPSIDSTAIDYYLACPYAYLYLRLLDAGPEPSGIEFVDAFFLGDVYHETLALLFERIREEDGSYRPERVEAYRGLLGPCLTRAFEALATKRGPFVAIVLEAYRGRLEACLSRFLDAEAERFPGLEIGPIEASFSLEYPGPAGGVTLRGRIDRISRSERGLVVVDYKKGRIPDRAEVVPGDSGSIAEAQIPCYLRLAGSGGEAIDSAWYVSIEGHERRAPGEGACAFGDAAKDKAYVPREGLEPFLAAFDAALERTVEGIAAGAFPLAPKEAQRLTCRECGARGICRERYAFRSGEAGS